MILPLLVLYYCFFIILYSAAAVYYYYYILFIIILLLAIALSACLTTAAAGRACASWSLRWRKKAARRPRTMQRKPTTAIAAFLLAVFCSSTAARKCRYPTNWTDCGLSNATYWINVTSSRTRYIQVSNRLWQKWLHWSNVYKCHGGVSAVLVTREALVQIFGLQNQRAQVSVIAVQNQKKFLQSPLTRNSTVWPHMACIGQDKYILTHQQGANWLRRHEYYVK